MKNLLKVVMLVIILVSVSKSMCLAKSAADWVPISGNQYNMIAYGHIHIDGATPGTGGYVLYSFGKGGERDCRSKNDVSPDGSYYATIRGNVDGEIINFKAYDSHSDKVYDLKDTITFKKDATIEGFALR